MSKLLSIVFIIVFCIHFIVFITLYIKRNKPHFLTSAGAFFFLTLYQGVRSWLPELMLLGHRVYIYLRIAAWIATATALLFYVRFRKAAAKDH